MSPAERPYTLVAELTYRCPLRCVYCSNPKALAGKQVSELETEPWVRVIGEAAGLGILQINLSGGEPLLRPDLEDLLGEAHKKGLYTNLITSGLGLTEARLDHLVGNGLDSVQISIQDVDRESAARIAGKDTGESKISAARRVTARGLPLTLNAVLHRGNMARVAEIIAMAEGLGASRLELANAQYLGWALENRSLLLPDPDLLDHARRIAGEAKQRLMGKMDILFVLPDYYSDRPRACQDGWARRYLLVNPYGTVLPCHAAASLPGLEFGNVREGSLEEIWRHSQGLNAFRGEDWMSPTCRSCEHRTRDFGGCRCQAYQLTGEASATDPACSKSPHHGEVAIARQEAQARPSMSGLGVLTEPRYRTLPRFSKS